MIVIQRRNIRAGRPRRPNRTLWARYPEFPRYRVCGELSPHQGREAFYQTHSEQQNPMVGSALDARSAQGLVFTM